MNIEANVVQVESHLIIIKSSFIVLWIMALLFTVVRKQRNNIVTPVFAAKKPLQNTGEVYFGKL